MENGYHNCWVRVYTSSSAVHSSIPTKTARTPYWFKLGLSPSNVRQRKATYYSCLWIKLKISKSFIFARYPPKKKPCSSIWQNKRLTIWTYQTGGMSGTFYRQHKSGNGAQMVKLVSVAFFPSSQDKLQFPFYLAAM